MIDDSDVFSIETGAAAVGRIFASACSGIYSSDNRGSLWTKLLGIPNTSRRTYAIRQDPFNARNIYAGTSQGLWKSSDRGVSWHKISPLIVRSMAFNARRADHIFFATEDAGLIASEDGGKTFQPINHGFVNRSLTSLLAGPDGLYATIPYGAETIYRFAGPDSWTPIGSALGSGTGRILGIFPGGGEIVVGFTTNSAVRSLDGGRSYSALPTPAATRVVTMRALAGPSSGILLGTSSGLYRSEDHGDHWVLAWDTGQPVNALFTGHGHIAQAVAVAASNHELALSRDRGERWSPISAPAQVAEIYDLDATPNGVLLAATSRGAYRSIDWGKSWRRIENGLTASTVQAISFDASCEYAVAAQNGIVYWSRDAGSTWTPLDATGLSGTSIRSLTLPESLPGKVFALTQFRGVLVSDLPGLTEAQRAAR
jgi:photosystem II stability/assembly factor-like uncharacterized protein